MSSPFDTSILRGEEPDFDEVAFDLQEQYDAIRGAEVDPIDVMPPDNNSTGVDVANLLFGDEMASVGIELDQQGFKWSVDTAKDFWSEHPIRAGLAVATTLLPMAASARQAWKGGKALGYTDDIVRQSGLVDEAFDLAELGAAERRMVEAQIDTLGRYRERMDKIDMLGDAAPVKDRAWAGINKAFSNTYLERMDPLNAPSVAADWRKRTGQLLAENGNFAYHLKDVPPDEVGTQIAAYLANPARLSEIPKQHQAWAVRMADDLKATQAQMIEEGVIAADEAANVGDVWFSTVRQGKQRDMGALTTLLDRGPNGEARLLSVPKTSSPNLLNRKANQQEVRGLIDKQLSTELLAAGKNEEALALLKGEGYETARTLIQNGENKKAIKLLTTGGKIDFSPQSLTFNSVFQQKMLLENFRMTRDLALNPDIVKGADFYSALSPGARRNWVNLDTLDGSDRIRRMVAKAKGVESVDSLGYVPKGLYKEIQDINGESFKTGTQGALKLLTALHKTMKTAFNIPTHASNVLGNSVFLVNAGVNPFSKDFLGLRKTAWKGIRSMQKARRSGKQLSDVKNIGMVKGPNGRSIDLAEELASSELSEIVEMSSLTTAEGLGVLEKLADSDDLVGTVAKYINKGISKSKLNVPADWYLAEDAMDKAAYFLHLRQRGLSRAGAAIEVGRRMPMYNTVGALPNAARSWALPWITFPSEAARILKNNMLDHPLKTGLLLQMPELAQVGVYGAARGMGQGMSAETIQQRKDQLATWAQRPSTVMTPLRDRNGDFRAMIMDFLPYTSVMPPTVSKEASAFQKLPFGADDPMPLLNGLYMAMSGKDSFGRDVPTDPDQPMQKVGVMAMSLASFIAPPMASKYMFNPTEIKSGYRFLQDMGKNVNPYTEKPGDLIFDGIVNNLSPMRAYPSSPEQQLSNQSFSDGRRSAYRSKLSREWGALLKSGDTEGAAGRLRGIMNTFSAEYPADAGAANREMAKWLKSHSRQLKNHPQLRRFSKQELEYKIAEVEAAASTKRTNAQQQMIETMRQELSRRGRSSGGGSRNPFFSEKFLSGQGGQVTGGRGGRIL